MSNLSLILPKSLRRVIFAGVPRDGYLNNGDLITLLTSGIQAARKIGQKIAREAEVKTESESPGVVIFSLKTGFFSAYAAVLASYCENKWQEPGYPYSTFFVEEMWQIFDKTEVGNRARYNLFRSLIPSTVEDMNTLVLVVSEDLVPVLSRAFCQFTGVPFVRTDDMVKPFFSITVHTEEKTVEFDINSEADW